MARRSGALVNRFESYPEGYYGGPNYIGKHMRLAKLDANLGINLGACVEAILDPSLGPSLGTRPRTFRCSVDTREPNLTRLDPTCPLGLWTAKTWPGTGPERPGETKKNGRTP